MASEILKPKETSPDGFLYLILDYLRSLSPEIRTAVVAGLYSYETGELLVATSNQFRDVNGRLTWNHAEYEVLMRSQVQGPVLFISSLSPCARESSTRAHPACVEVLTGSGITSEYTGKIDNNAVRSGHYRQLGFEANLTEDPTLLKVCDDLYYFFYPFKQRGWNKERIITAALKQLPKKKFI